MSAPRVFTVGFLLTVIGVILLSYAGPLLAWLCAQPLPAALTALGLLLAGALAWWADGKVTPE